MIRNLFSNERAWRAFIVLQIIGFAGVAYLDITNPNWSILPSKGYRGFDWDLANSWHYTRYSTNWYVLALLFGPFLSAKAYEWIASGNSRTAIDLDDQIAERMKADLIACTREIKGKWLTFTATLKFKSGVPLADIIEAFAQPASQFVENHYPALLTGGGQMFWMMISTAILEAGTHPKDEVNKAIAALEVSTPIRAFDTEDSFGWTAVWGSRRLHSLVLADCPEWRSTHRVT